MSYNLEQMQSLRYLNIIITLPWWEGKNIATHYKIERISLTSRPGSGNSSVLYANIQCLVAREDISCARMTILYLWTVKRTEKLILICFTKFQIFEKSCALMISIMSTSHCTSLPDPSSFMHYPLHLASILHDYVLMPLLFPLSSKEHIVVPVYKHVFYITLLQN